MDLHPTRAPSLLAVVATAVVLFVGGACAQSNSPRPPAALAPPVDASEETVQAANGQAAAALVVSSAQLPADESVTLQVANRGQVALNYGRPVTVERWTGTAWQETPESRDTAWTMELLQVEPGRSGVEQPWPFRAAPQPAPGWYRFSKEIFGEDRGGNPVRLLIRARVEVLAP